MEVTKEEIEEFLKKLREAIKCGKISINKVKPKNREFIEKYNLTDNKILRIIRELTVEDFGKKELNRNRENEIVYIFCKSCILNFWGIEETKNVYIKISEGRNYFVLSFHELEYSMKHGIV